MKTANGAIVTGTDIPTDNGVIHIVEKVLYPPTVGNVVETLRSDPENRFTTLLKALKFTGLLREISDYSSKWGIYQHDLGEHMVAMVGPL